MQPEPDPLAQRLQQRYAGLRVLVADDDEASRLVLSELMLELGLAVDTVADGQEAVEAVQAAAQRPYGLVLLDLRMPRLDGIGAARGIRKLPGGRELPMIAVTANAFDEDCRAFQAEGVERILPKPVDVAYLYRVMLELLEQGPVAAPAVSATPALPPGLKAVAACDGVDASRGLAAVGGREAVYRKLLRLFVDSHDGDGQRAAELLRQGQSAEAGMLVHRLRGSAATLGLVDVEGAAALVEEAVHAGRPGAEAQAAALAAAVSDTVRALRQALAG